MLPTHPAHCYRPVPSSTEMRGPPGWHLADLGSPVPTKVPKWLVATPLYLPSEGPRKDLHTRIFFYGEKIRTVLDINSKLQKKKLHKLRQASGTTTVSQGLNLDTEIVRLGSKKFRYLTDNMVVRERQKMVLMHPHNFLLKVPKVEKENLKNTPNKGHESTVLCWTKLCPRGSGQRLTLPPA